MWKTIFSRRSIRSYTGEKASPDQLQQVLKAGQAAAVGRGRYDSIHLTVISKQAVLNAIEDHVSKLMGEEVHPLFGAPQMILISVKPGGKEADNVELSSVGCIAQNMSLAATELGLGSCLIWGAVGRVAKTDLVIQFELPEGYLPVGGVILGQTREQFSEDSDRHHIEVQYLD